MTLNVGEKRGKKGEGGQVQRRPDSQLSQKNFGSSSFAFSVDSEFRPSSGHSHSRSPRIKESSEGYFGNANTKRELGYVQHTIGDTKGKGYHSDQKVSLILDY